MSCTSPFKVRDTLSPSRNLDHSVSEDIVKSIVVTSNDFDNDPVTTTVTLTTNRWR
ncbi:hypothetical protein OH492_09170 [Vibrio chagasii]|nr:hypothetical protein [Vibrio chagasii]